MKRSPAIVILLLLWLITGLGWVWTASLWQEVWIDRSFQFYPPEWREPEQMARLNAQAPLYRENDTYYWVYLTKEAQEDGKAWGSTRFDGLGEERPVKWGPILPSMLSLAGSIHSTVNSTDYSQGLFWAGHWLNPWIGWLGCGLLAFLIFSRFGFLSSGIFLLLSFACPTLQWVFAASRLDHHSLQVLLVGVQVIAFSSIFAGSKEEDLTRPLGWGLLAGVCTAIGVAISATPQLLVSSVFTATCALFLLFFWKGTPNPRAFFCTYGVSGAALTMIFAALWTPILGMERDITGLHPIHGIAILGSGLFLSGLYRDGESPRNRRRLICGLICGLAPLFWILFDPESGHVWLNPFVSRMHEYISDYRSVFLEGHWRSPQFWLPIITFSASAFGLRTRSTLFAFSSGALLLCLALWQQRWLAEFSIIAIIVFSISRYKGWRIVGTALVLLSLSLWLREWTTIRDRPGEQFSADLLLRTLGRDIAVNLDNQSGDLSEGEALRVAMVYDFAPQTLAFPRVKPVGSLYWENREGLGKLAELFDERDPVRALDLARSLDLDFVVVQPRGARFAEMNRVMNDSLVSDSRPSLAARLSEGSKVPEGWEEIPFSGTFDPRRVDARIYRVMPPATE